LTAQTFADSPGLDKFEVIPAIFASKEYDAGLVETREYPAKSLETTE
jgi:hypothetical protein